VTLFALGVVLKKGLPERFSSETIDMTFQFSHIDKNQCPSLVNLGCAGGDTNGEREILLYGNSHAEHYFELISRLASDTGSRVKLFASGGCSLLQQSAKCDSTKSAYLEDLSDGTDISILAFRWDSNFSEEPFLAELDELVTQAQGASERVIVMAQPPLLNFSPSKIENCNRLGIRCPRPEQAMSERYPAYNDAIRARVEALGAEFFDPYIAVEDSSQLYDEDRLLYSDMDHLSVYGGRWLHGQLGDSEKALFSQ
jgi:hypothetical protein